MEGDSPGEIRLGAAAGYTAVEQDGTLKVLQNSDTLSFSHNGTSAYQRWSDGFMIFQTDEGTNTNSRVEIMGKGTGYGTLFIYDEDDAEELIFRATGGNGLIRMQGDSPGEIRIGGASNYASFETDGEINLVGTARVIREAWIPFNALRAPGTKPATYVDHGISGAWEFSDGTDDTLVGNIKFPADMDMSVAPTMCVGWSTTTTVTSETATWQLEYLYTAEGEDTSAAAQGTISVNSDAIAQAEGLIVAPFPTMDTPGASDVCMHFRLKRLGAGGNDDLTDTAELHGVVMRYTSNKLGTAT